MAIGRPPKHDIVGKIVRRFDSAPKHDTIGKIVSRFNNLKHRKPPKKDDGGEMIFVDPTPKPRPLIGGAAVEIE